MQFTCIGSYSKPNEKRVPIHPDHIDHLPKFLREQMFFDTGYGEPFGMSDDELSQKIGGMGSRETLMSESDTVLILKPQKEDLELLKPGALLWGWPHSVQHRAVAEVAIENKLTVIAMERMFPWGPSGERGQHFFYKNGELAGVAGVHHSFNLVGIDGHYGPSRKALVIGTGSSSRGALLALQSRGIYDISVVEIRPGYKAKDHKAGCAYYTLKEDGQSLNQGVVTVSKTLKELIFESDIVVNAIFQNPNKPLHFFKPEETAQMKKGALIIDISCDEGMGFPFAVPTQFDHPILDFGHFQYYAVDHMPTKLWQSASWTISEALLPFLEPMIQDKWRENTSLYKSLDFDKGVIQDPAIWTFQKRSSTYPHDFLT